MKFANIDDAITEAAKKPVPKVASPKADPKKAAPKKVAPKKVDPKETPASVAPTKKPAAPKKAAAPVAVPKKKATSSKVPKTVVKKKKSVAPAPAAEPETREEPATEPEQKPAEPKPTQGSDSSERPKFAPRWLQSKPRGIGDRLKSAWKGFTAKSGQDLGKAGTSYKSVFHEIHKLMEQLQLVEAMLQEQSLNESYDAGTVNNLYEHRNTIRSVLVEQIVREELYMHNVTIAELDQRQRAALMETVNVRANALWEGLEEAESEEEYDPNSFETSADHIEWSTTPQDDDDDDYDTVNYSNGDMPESYTLEEWMGMMEEAGVNLNELSPETMGSARDQRLDQAQEFQDQITADLGFVQASGEVLRGVNAAHRDNELRRIQRDIPANRLERDYYLDKANRTDVHMGGKGELDVDTNTDAEDAHQLGPHSTLDKRGRYIGIPDRRELDERYSLEEWMGMMEEAGYNVEEGKAENKAKKNAFITKQGKSTLIAMARDGVNSEDKETPWLKGKLAPSANNIARDAANSPEMKRFGRQFTKFRKPRNKEAAVNEKNMNQMTRDERDHAIASARDVVQKKVKGTSPADVKAAQHAATVAQLLKRLGRAQTGTPEMEEGKLSRLAAGLGLAGAAMMGSPNDAGAQQSQPTQAPTAQVPNDSVQTGNSRDMQMAVNKANFELDRKKISRQGARQNVVKNPDGTYTATVDARKQPKSGAPQMEDKYTFNENTVARLQQLAGIKPIK